MSDDAERERARYEALSTLVENYRRERDDAREQLYLTKRELGRWVDRETKAVRERDEARASVADAYRRGAEAMREACLGVVERFMDFGSPHPGMIAHKMSALPIPEDK